VGRQYRVKFSISLVAAIVQECAFLPMIMIYILEKSNSFDNIVLILLKNNIIYLNN
jgi:hypothetical protein